MIWQWRKVFLQLVNEHFITHSSASSKFAARVGRIEAKVLCILRIRASLFSLEEGFGHIATQPSRFAGGTLNPVVMHCLTVAPVLILPYLIDLTLTAPSFTIGQPSTSQLLKFNTTLNATSINPSPNASYEVYEIPESDLRLHLTFLLTLDRLAMQ